MSNIEQVSKSFRDLCERAGWHSGRSVNCDHWIASLTGEGFVCNEISIELLKSFGGLVIHLPAAGISPYDHELRVDPVIAATGDSDRAIIWGAGLGITLFPVGEETTSGNVIWIGSDGKFYYGREFGLYLLGDSITNAMDQLAFPSINCVLCAN